MGMYPLGKPIVTLNVSRHEGSVTKIAMEFSDYLNLRGVPNDSEKVLRMAAFHADDELVSHMEVLERPDTRNLSGDFGPKVMELEEFDRNDVFDMLGMDGVPHLARYWFKDGSKQWKIGCFDWGSDPLWRMVPGDSESISKKYMALQAECRECETRESRIIRLADYADAVLYARSEMSLGNTFAFAGELSEATEKFNLVLHKFLKEEGADDGAIPELENDMKAMTYGFLADMISKTARTSRYNTVECRVSQNVLEHEGRTTKIALLISDVLNVHEVRNDPEKVLRMAITHDDDEIGSADLPHAAKYQYGELSKMLRKALSAVNSAALDAMGRELYPDELRQKFRDTVQEYEEKRTIESRIVKLADFADVIAFAENEEGRGNEHASKERETASKKFESLLDEVIDTFVR